MSDSLDLTVVDFDLKNLAPFAQLQPMLESIQANMPKINQASQNFMKRQSQFMDNQFTIHHPTPIRNMRQILAQIAKTKEAIRYNYYKMELKKIKTQILERDLESETDELKAKRMRVKIEGFKSSLESSKGYFTGAIRELKNYVDQYNAILESHEIPENWDELDFENEEEEYHIKKAFEQALIAARARPDASIDEGNQIYMSQIGINGTAAKFLVKQFLMNEEAVINQSLKKLEQNPGLNQLQLPTYESQLNFLERMYQTFKGCTAQFAKHKGTILHGNEAALLIKAPEPTA